MYQQRFAPRRNFRGNAPRQGGFRGAQKTMSTQELMALVEASKYAKTSDVQNVEEAYQPEQKFADFPLNEQLKNNIIAKNYVLPTPIQDKAIPAIIQGQDVIGIANTGTGKTAAFLIPLINKVIQSRNQKVLIVTPTRELAMQIFEEWREFSRGLGMFAALVTGGASLGRQQMELRRNPNFVIGTPGRIKDLCERRILNLNLFQNVVLDETDRMVDIGFINDIKYFISLLPKERQSLFFSATVSPKVQEILQSFVQNPVTVSVKKNDNSVTIDQDIIKLSPTMQKIDQLHDLLSKEEFEKVLIFGRTKWGIQKLTDQLVLRGFKAGAIHGNKNQGQRQRVLREFKNDQIKILLATDVASRGLDINDVSHVINYDLPGSYEDYIHRIGRTGRANKRGIALTFVD